MSFFTSSITSFIDYLKGIETGAITNSPDKSAFLHQGRVLYLVFTNIHSTIITDRPARRR